jgi:hypothetical protein
MDSVIYIDERRECLRQEPATASCTLRPTKACSAAKEASTGSGKIRARPDLASLAIYQWGHEEVRARATIHAP